MIIAFVHTYLIVLLVHCTIAFFPYPIAGAESENNSKFLMHASTLWDLTRQRIANNKSVDEINDRTDELSDLDYI